MVDRTWFRLVGLLAGIAVLAWMIHFAYVHAAAIDVDWTRVRVQPAILSFVILLASYACFASAWGVLADRAGLRVPWGQQVQYWNLTLPSKYLPGKVWQGLSRLALYRDHRSGAASVMAIALEAMAQISCASMLGGIALLAAAGDRQRWLPFAAILFGVSTTAMLCTRPLGAVVDTITRRLGFPRPPAVSRRVLAAVLIWQAVGYLLMIAAYVLVVAAIGFDGLAILPSLAGALLLSGVAGLLAIVVPAGVGVRDAAFAWIIVGVVPAQTAVMLSLLSRVWLIAGDIFAFVVAAALRAVTARHR